MRMFLVIAALIFISACEKQTTEPGSTAAEPAAAGAAEAPATATPTATAGQHVYKVACNHALKEGNACGNMIEVEGKYIPLTGDIGLGEMEFCGKEGLEAKVEGAVDGDKFVATSFELVDAKP